jgi:NTP pyrophosphatase (non-canonical NTP hydrolase)
MNQPGFPDSAVQGSHYEHIVEELEELRIAINKDTQDIVEIADALGDLVWVALRMTMIHGLDINYVMTKIYESNMSKFCESKEEAEQTVTAYLNGEHPAKKGHKIKCYFQEMDNGRYYVIKRESDHKVMKSINYVEPDFSELLGEEVTQ